MPHKYFRIPVMCDLFKLILLACLTIIIYLPSLKSGFFVFDDLNMVEGVKRIEVREIWPHLSTAGGRYWRPVNLLSFLFDVHFLNANSSLMHLHNVLIHTTNIILVFLISRSICSIDDHKNEFPLLAAALFAIHPINTESVNWISGRTDLYASFFALAGTYLFLLSVRSKRVFLSFLSALFIMLGCLTKEVAFALFPAAIISLLLVDDKRLFTKAESQLTWKMPCILPFLIGPLGYLWIRSRAFINSDEGISKIINNTSLSGPSLTEQFMTGVTALGFYIKKIFIPYPLNFAIDHVSHLYLWGGLLSIFIISLIIHKRHIESTLLIFMLFTISPAILNSIFRIAWTPYAERYLYLPTALICIYLFTPNKLTKMSLGRQKILLSAFFLFALTLTVNRNIEWGDPLTVLLDSIHQNPNNTTLRINYAVALEGRFGPLAARDELHIASGIAPENQFIRRNLALIALKSLKEPLVARNDLNVFFNGTQIPEAKTLSLMIEVNEERLADEEAPSSPSIREELFLSYKKYHLMSGNPSYLFAAVENATSVDHFKSVTGLLQKMYKDLSMPEVTRTKAGELLSTIHQTEQGEFWGPHH